jgi:pyruvate/2-oxoacid:ferredoxin oxidoreductase beta subunit
MAMSYGNIYVAEVAMGARDEQTLRSFLEAESFDGPVFDHRLQPLHRPRDQHDQSVGQPERPPWEAASGSFIVTIPGGSPRDSTPW